MCSVVGYVGKQLSKAFILQGLSRLEYRGYDSAGFACIDSRNNQMAYAKAQGPLEALRVKCVEQPIDGYVGIGHTRWATHGIANEENAHPQFDCHQQISVIHNGIIENHSALKSQLVNSGHFFASQTDTEVIAHLFEVAYAHHQNARLALLDMVSKLEGAYATIIIAQQDPTTLMAARRGSPLCLGFGKDEMYIASDVFAFAGLTRKVLFVPDNCIALVKQETVELYDFAGRSVPQHIQEIDVVFEDNGKAGFEHYMLKEIYEQPRAIQATLQHFQARHETIWQELGLTADYIKNLESVCLVGSGTSWHAARIAQFFYEMIAKIPTSVMLSSEFKYMPFFPKKQSFYMLISQSGETADTLEALRLIKTAQVPTLALTNTPSSTMVRETGGALCTQAGQEIAVASTKAFSTQLAASFWLAHRIALEKEIITADEMSAAMEALLVAGYVLESSIEQHKYSITKQYAPFYAQFKRFIFLGRHMSYPFALEAALKLKEISYIFAQCYPAGELKHGPIALIDAETPVFIFSCLDELLYHKLLSNAQEVKARKGHIIAFVFEGQHELLELADCAFVIPRVHPLLAPLAMTGLMQFFVYSIAKELGCSIDKPRNLAKSVTVE